MALEHVPRCQHVKVNGVQCGSPALRNRSHCYFHTRVEHERKLAVGNTEGERSFGFPLLEDANSIQVALMKVIQMLGAGALDHKTAGLMLYALQTASYNLRQTRFEPEKATEVVIDEDTVDLTRIQGPQWAARDFPPSAPPEAQDLFRDDVVEDEVPENDAVEDDVPEEALLQKAEPERTRVTPSAAPAAVSARPEVKSEASVNALRTAAAHKPATVDPAVADAARRRDQKRKLQRDIDLDNEPNSLAKILLQRMGLPPMDEEGGNERETETVRQT
jgi:hypothetical protein